MLYSFEVEIPIIYNSHEINYTKPEYGDKYKIERIIKDFVLVPCTFHDIHDNIDYSVDERIGIIMDEGRDKDFCVCLLSGIIADNHRKAGRIANAVIYNICRGLTFLINKKNSNKHIFQPRLEADWENATWKHRGFDADGLVNCDKGLVERLIRASDGMTIIDSVFISSETIISADEITIKKWEDESNEDIRFLLDEYYIAMGTENIKSKFFHLFSIIEFCENRFAEKNNSQKVLSPIEVKAIKNSIIDVVSLEKKGKVVDAVSKRLIELTDMGREEKLLNILHWMNINTISLKGLEYELTKDMLKEFTVLRGKSYHGAVESGKKKEEDYKQAIEKLFIIDEKIIDYLMDYLPKMKCETTEAIRSSVVTIQCDTSESSEWEIREMGFEEANDGMVF